jgi:hypothetical protein
MGALEDASRSPLSLLKMLKHGTVDQFRPSASEHMTEYSKRQVPALLQMLRGTGKHDGSIYDRSKNYAGGYDWGVRQAQDPDLARNMAKSYQLWHYLTGQGSPADAEGDYLENLAGVEAAVRDANAGPPLGGKVLLNHAIDWAKSNPRRAEPE